MTVTEGDAQSKWCPHARVDSTAANRPNPGNNCDVSAGWAPCIGSVCMAWRWESQASYDERYEAWEDAHNIGGIGSPGPEPVQQGYCGLAGVPSP